MKVRVGSLYLPELTPKEILATAAPWPDHFTYAKDTDVEAEIGLIWSIVTLFRPRTVVELGTRHGITTRAIADAMGPRSHESFYTVDPDDCAPYLMEAGVRCIFIPLKGEDFFYSMGGVHGCGSVIYPDILMIDTDPHTYEQTTMWLDTWIQECLAPGGVAMFHDIVGARPEIQVVEAVRDWMTKRGGQPMTEGSGLACEGWIWREYVADTKPTYGPYGLGLLWKWK